jgi:hypothetical protein
MFVDFGQSRNNPRPFEGIGVTTGIQTGKLQRRVSYDLHISIERDEMEQGLKSLALAGYNRVVHCLTKAEPFFALDGCSPCDINLGSSIKAGCIKVSGVLAQCFDDVGSVYSGFHGGLCL